MALLFGSAITFVPEEEEPFYNPPSLTGKVLVEVQERGEPIRRV
jgi:hypothetical protein